MRNWSGAVSKIPRWQICCATSQTANLGQNAYADRARFPAPDVVLLDLRLPRLDGLDVLRRVKAHPATRALPIVVLTTSDMERDAAIAHNHHANSFLTKPVDAERLNQVLQQLGPSKQ